MREGDEMKFNRREYLKISSLGAIAASLSPKLLWGSQAEGQDPQPEAIRGAIDWHSHWISPTEIRLLSQRKTAPRLLTNDQGGQAIQVADNATFGGHAKALGKGEMAIEVADNATGVGQPFKVLPRDTDLDSRIHHLDQHGVKRQVICCTTPLGYDAALSAEELKPLLSGFNDDLAQFTKKYPDRYSGLAALATSDVEWSARELERTRREYGFLGGSLPLNAFATLEGARMLAPIFKKAQSLHSHLLIHRGAASPLIPGQPTLVINKDTDYARATLATYTQLAAGAITLGLSDFLDAYPDVTVQVVMLGGSIPYMMELIQSQASQQGLADPVQRFRRIYLDPGPYCTLPRTVAMTVEVFGADRMLFGSDYGPMPDIGLAMKRINESKLSLKERNQIFVENGTRLLDAKGVKA
jgi:predicted TIM-barrel fold metal-dependent hydrolase